MPEAIVIPGLVAIDPRRWDGSGPAEIVRGPLAGKASLPDVSDWKREIWLLPREVAARHGVRNPGERAELELYPHLRARLAEAALVLVDEGAAGRATAAGDTAIYIGYHRVASGGNLEVHGRDGARGFSATDYPLLAQACGDAENWTEDRPFLATVYDRILRALTDGALSLYDVDLADDAAHLSVSEFAAFEAELAEIEAMAAAQRPLAESLLAALAAAEADAVTLPGGYQAQRRREPAFVLRSDGDVSVVGPPIHVPAGERWFVADVQAFTPPGREARRARAFEQVRAANRRATWQPLVLLLVGLLAVCALAVR